MNSKSTRNAPDVAHYIKVLETAHDARLAATKIHNRDLSEYIPADLRSRLSKLIHLALLPSDAAATHHHHQPPPDADDEDGAVDGRSVDLSGNAEVASPRSLRESNITAVGDRERQFEYLSLHLDPPPEPRKPPVLRPLHWLSRMRDQCKHDRICWPSKIYRFDRMFSQRSLFDQAEQMMDWGADDFVTWLATIGDPDDVSTVSRDVVKQLFSIGAEGDASRALYVEPQLRKAIPHAMAGALGIPKMSLDYNVNRLLHSDERNKLRPSHRRVAFGRSKPSADCFESCADGIRPLEPRFPASMRSKRAIFEGITHLRATGTLVEHLRDHREIRKPAYLVEQRMFAANRIDGEIYDDHVPLHRDQCQE